MARPLKDGVSYWPFDADFFQNKKIRLIKGEFGLTGEMIVIMVINEIYRTGGCCKRWDMDDSILLAENAGCEPSVVQSVVQRCCERGIFDLGVFEQQGMLTSRGIQRRFLRMVSSRGSVRLPSECFLLDMDDPEDVPASLRGRIELRGVSSTETVFFQKTAVSFEKTAVCEAEIPPKQIKENKRIKEETESTAERRGCAAEDDFSRLIKEPNAAERIQLRQLSEKYGDGAVREAISDAARRGGRSANYVARILSDMEPQGRAAPTHDLSEVERMSFEEWFGDELAQAADA